MNYNVVWTSEAEDELAALWLDPDLRVAVTRASRRIDERLALNGPDEGESRTGNRRITFQSPLAVTFLVDQLGRRITVTHVWLFHT